LDEQISDLKRQASLVTLEAARAFVDSTLNEETRRGRSRALIAVDDGCLDDYELAFPTFRTHGLQGVFSPAPSAIRSAKVVNRTVLPSDPLFVVNSR
jgi:hypothetical protein